MIVYEASPFLRLPASRCVVKPRVVRVKSFHERAVEEFRQDIQRSLEQGQPVIPVVIDSYGGQVYSLLAMVDILDAARHHTKIATIVEGKAMSCGAGLLAAGDKDLRFVGPNATVMVHGVRAGGYGRVTELASQAEEVRRLEVKLYDLLDKRSGQKAGYFAKLVHDAGHADRYLDPKACLKHKLADKVGLPQLLVRVEVDFGFGVPEKRQ